MIEETKAWKEAVLADIWYSAPKTEENYKKCIRRDNNQIPPKLKFIVLPSSCCV
jgi:hypothetical protein